MAKRGRKPKVQANATAIATSTNAEAVPTKKSAKRSSPEASSDDEQPPTTVVSDQPAAKRYRLRSGAVRNAAANLDDGNDKENSSLEISAKQPAKTKAKSKPKPFIEYKGVVEYYTEAEDIEAACDKLLCVQLLPYNIWRTAGSFSTLHFGIFPFRKWVQTEAKRDDVETIPIAFDMEWPFSFQTGPGRSAVIQMCADIGLCYVLHISKLKTLPESLLEVLYHEKVCLHGVCIKKYVFGHLCVGG